MNKKKRENLRFVVAASIKPPAFELDETGGENHRYKCVYVTNGGIQVTHKCTRDVWKTCEGVNREGRPRNGLSDKLGSQFILWIDGSKNTDAPNNASKGLVVAADVIPEVFYQRRQTMPDNIKDHETIDFKFVANNSVEVTMVPAGVTRKTIENMLIGLNQLEKIDTGDVIQGGFDVASVSGNTVSVYPPVRTV